MSLYYAHVSFSPAGPPDCALNIIGSTTARAGLCDLELSSDATPGEQTTKYEIIRTTTAGTGAAAFTPEKANNFSPNAGSTVQVGQFTVEPTLAAVAISRRNSALKGTYHWVAYPGREIWSTGAAANTGIAINVLTQSAAHAVVVTGGWIE